MFKYKRIDSIKISIQEQDCWKKWEINKQETQYTS